MKFEEKLIILRKKALYSQEDLAEKLDVTRQTVSKWELGQSKPDMDKLVEISKLFDVNVDLLTNDEASIEEPKVEESKEIKKPKKERKFLLYIFIIIFIASLSVLFYRTSTDIKRKISNKINEIKEGTKKLNNQEFDNEYDDTKDEIDSVREKINEEMKKQQIDSFNRKFESWLGTQTDSGVSFELDDIIENNKKNKERLIEVIFDGNSYGTDPESIKSIKNNLRTFNGHEVQKYEVSLDYNDDGYAYKLTIETR